MDKLQMFLKENVSGSVRDLLKKMLQKEPDERICIHDILKHPWFEGTEKPARLFS